MMMGAVLACWCVVSLFNPNNMFGSQNAIGQIFAFIYISYFLFKKVHWIAGLSYLYFSATALRIICFPQYFFPGFDDAAVVGFQSLVTEAHLFFTLIVLSFSLMRDETVKEVQRFFVFTAFTNSIVMWTLFIMGKPPYFLFNNPAIDASFLSCCLPLCYTYVRKNIGFKFGLFLMILVSAPCVFTKTSSGIIGLGVSIAAYFWCQNEFKRKNFMIGLYVAGFMAWLGWFMQGEVLFNGSGRYEVWSLAFKYYRESVNIWTGSGAGTTMMIMPGLQIVQSLMHHQSPDGMPGFLWLHNDWLQVLVETGIIGLVFLFLVFVVALWNLRRNPTIFSSLVTFGVIAVTQMPLRWFMFAAFGGMLLIRAFRSPEEATY